MSLGLSSGKNIAITGAGNQDTGFKTLTSVNLELSAAGTVNIRETSGAGTIVAQKVLGAAGSVIMTFPGGMRCNSGSYFVENTAGNVSGGVAGRVN